MPFWRSYFASLTKRWRSWAFCLTANRKVAASFLRSQDLWFLVYLFGTTVVNHACDFGFETVARYNAIDEAVFQKKLARLETFR